MNRANAAAVLVRHGVDPAADETTLIAALAARGWQVSVDEVALSRGRQGQRYRAVGRHRDPARRAPRHLQHSGRTAAEALARALATVLERER